MKLPRYLILLTLVMLLTACAPTTLLPTPTITPLPSPLPSEVPSPIPTPTPVSLPSSLGKVAYVQGGDIWVRALPEGQPQRLTTDGQNREPRWSPSGEWLAFRKGEEQVWVVRADGSAAHVVHDGAAITAFAWAPTQDRLAYASGNGALMVVDADGANQQELVGADVGQPYTGVVSFAWSPDGAWLAYEYIAMRQEGERIGRNASLWRIRADGRDAAELLNAGTETYEPLLAGWVPDGSALLYWVDPMYSRSLLADGAALYVLPARGGAPRPLTEATLAYPDFVVPGPVGSSPIAVIAGGYRGVWTVKQLTLFSTATGEGKTLTSPDVAASSPAWSPDGSRIAYVAMPDRGDLGGGNEAKPGLMQRRLFILNAQGEPQPRQLTDDPAYRDEAPVWLSGNYLLFARLDGQDRASLWIIPAEGGTPRQVVDELTPAPGWFGYYGHVDWWLLFDVWQGPSQPVLPTPLPMRYNPTPLPGVPDLVACPDGPDTDEVCLPDGNVRLIGYLSMPPDGSEAYFILNRGLGRSAVMVIPAEGHPGQTLRQLRDANTLALVEGQVISLDPPTLLVVREQAAARPFSPDIALSEVYSSTKLGIVLNFPAGWIVEDRIGKEAGSIAAIRNYHSKDAGSPPTVQPDPSLYTVEIVPVLPTQAQTIAQMREQIQGRVLREQAQVVNGLETLRLTVDVPSRGQTEVLLVQLPWGVLLLQTWQDAALFDRMIATLRMIPDG